MILILSTCWWKNSFGSEWKGTWGQNFTFAFSPFFCWFCRGRTFQKIFWILIIFHEVMNLERFGNVVIPVNVQNIWALLFLRYFFLRSFRSLGHSDGVKFWVLKSGDYWKLNFPVEKFDLLYTQCAKGLNSPSIDTPYMTMTLFIFFSKLSASGNTFDNFTPMQYLINTKINSCGISYK